MTAITPKRSTRSFRAMSVFLAILMIAPNGVVFAAPAGGQVVRGSGTISSPSAGHTRIDQQSQRLALDWQSFDVGTGERVQFVQPNRNAVALNRILDGKASQIFGQIDANGRVILQNSHGILFGRTAMIDTGGLVATSLNVDLDAFARGDAVLVLAENPEAAGAIVNEGIINAATGGSVALVGGAVRNDGIITARLGRVDLAAGSEAILTFDADNLIGVRVSKDVLRNVGGDAAVSNSGDIIADGGVVMLSAAAARELFDTAVNNAGLIESVAAEDRGGRIFLTGSATSGNVVNSGILDASGAGAGGEVRMESAADTLVSGNAVVRADSSAGAGGSVQLLGHNVGLFDAAGVSASGAAGGGTVLVGGDFQGANADVRNAAAVYVGENVSIRADATAAGDGGKLVVWSDESSRIYGSLSARGGAAAGDGGLVETSSHDFLDITRTADVTAANGAGGTWLIDPRNVTITSGAVQSNITGSSPFVPGGTGSLLGVDLINAALTGGANVQVQSTGAGGPDEGDIIWQNGVFLNYDGKGSNTLTLNAFDDIIYGGMIGDSTLASTDSLSVVFTAADDILLTGVIETRGGTVTMTANNGNGGQGVGATNTSGIVFEDNGSPLDQIYGRVVAGPGDVNLTANGVGSAILVDFGGNEVYGALLPTNPGPISGHNITLNAPVVRTSDVVATNQEVVATGNVILNVGGAQGQTVFDYLDVVLAGAGTGVLTVNDAAAGDIRLRALYDDIAGTEITQAAANTGLIEIAYNKTISVPVADGVLRLLNDPANHVIDNLQTFNQDIKIDVGSGELLTTALSTVLINGGDLALANNSATGGISLNNGTLGLAGTTLDVKTIGGDVVLLVNAGGVNFSDTSDVGDDLSVTSSAGFVALNNMNVANFVDVTLNGLGSVLSTGSGFTYGATFNAQTTGGNINATVASVGVLNTALGLTGGGNINLQSRTGDDISVNLINTRDGTVTIGADRDLTINGTVDTLNGGTFGGVVDLTAGRDLTLLDFVHAGSANILLTAGAGGAGSNNTVDSLGTFGSLFVNGGAGLDQWLFDATGISGSFAQIAGGIGDKVTLDGNDGANHAFEFDQNDVRVDGAAADFRFTGAVDLEVIGSGVNDVFSLTGNRGLMPYASVVLEGGGGSDTFAGFAQANTWNVDGVGTGDLGVFQFNDVEILGGSTSTDIFRILDGGSIAQVIGGGSVDHLDFSFQTAGDVTVDLENGTTNGGVAAFTTISGATGRFMGNNTLIGLDDAAAHTWSISGGNNNGSYDSFQFSNFGNLTGGSGNDLFTFAASNSVSGLVQGGGGTDRIDMSAYVTPVIVYLETGAVSAAAGGFTGVEEFVGNGVNSEVRGDNTATNWVVGASSVTVNGTHTFTGFTKLEGNLDNDTYEIAVPTIAEIYDFGGDDTLDFSASGSPVFVNLETTLANGILFTDIENFVGSLTGPGDQLAGVNQNVNWTIDGAGDGTLQGSGPLYTFTDFETLVGGTLDDTFVFNPTGAVAVIDGGIGGGYDAADFTGYNEALTISATGIGSAVTLVGMGFNGLEEISADADEVNFAYAPDMAMTFDVFADRSFTANSGSDPFDLINFDELHAGNQNDIIIFSGGSLSVVDGGGGTDLLDFSGDSRNLDWTLGGSASIDDADLATPVVGQLYAVEDIGGSAGDDMFLISSPFIAQTLAGGTGTDTLDYSVDAAATSILLTGSSTDGYAGYGNGIVGGFSGIDAVTGSGISNSSVTGEDVASSWTLGAGADSYQGSGVALAFDGFDYVQGGNANNSFDVQTGHGIATLLGGNGDDSFTLGATVATLDGGNHILGDAIVGTASGDTVQLAGGGAGDFNGGSFAGIEVLDGAGGTDALTAADSYNIWTVADDDGSVQGFSFYSFEDLFGGSDTDQFSISGTHSGGISGNDGSDLFTLASGAAVAGGITGGTGTFDIVRGDNAAADAVVLAVGAGSGTFNSTGFAGIESVDGGFDGGNSLTGSSSGETFNIIGATSGSVLGLIDFTGFDTLAGGAGADTFELQNLVVFAGNLAGDAGNDAFVINGDSRAAGFDGGADSDTFDAGLSASGILVDLDGNMVATGAGLATLAGVETLVGSAFDDTVIGTSGADLFELTGAGEFNLGTLVFSGFNQINGGVGNDTLEIAGGSIDRFVGGTDIDTIAVQAGSGIAADFGGLNDGGGNDGYVYDSTNVQTAVGSFDDVDVLQGAEETDSFSVTGPGFAGDLRGGAGADSFYLSALLSGMIDGEADSDLLAGSSAADVFILASAGTGTANGTNFTGIEQLDGAAGPNRLVGTAGADEFNLFTAGTAGSVTGVIDFDGFSIFDGDNGADDFHVAGNGTATIYGGSGSDTLDHAGGSLGAGSAFFGGNFGGGDDASFDVLTGLGGDDAFTVGGFHQGTLNSMSYDQVEILEGGGGNDSITATTGLGESWLLDDGGSSIAAPSIAFSGIANVFGSTGNDTITIDNFTGAVDARAGNDIIDLVGALDGSVTGGADGDDIYLSGGSVTGQIAGGEGGSDNDLLLGGTGADNFVLGGVAEAGSLNGIAFVGIEQLHGNSGTDTLTGTATNDVFTINAADAGNVGGFAFADMENLEGAGGDDIFSLSTGGISGLIDGGANNDTVSYAAYTGPATIDSTTLTGIEILAGSSFNDTLLGTGGNDVVTVSGTTAGDLDGLAFSGIELIDLLAGVDTVNGSGSNDLFQVGAGDSATLLGISFSGVDALAGGAGDDTFNLLGSFTGQLAGDGDVDGFVLNGYTAGGIDGGADADEIYGSAAAETLAVSGTGAGSFAGVTFADIEYVQGNGGGDDIVGTGAADTFTLNGLGAVEVTSAGINTLGFSSIDAGNGADLFVLAASDALSLAGAAGDDTFEFAGTSSYGGTFDGGADTDTVLGSSTDDVFAVSGLNAGFVNGTTFTGIEALDGRGQTTLDVLTGSSGNDTWTLDDAGSSVAGMAFSDIESVNAGSGTNTFNIQDFTGDVYGNGNGDTFNLIGALTGSVYGQAGADLFVLQGGSVSGTLDGGLDYDELQGSTGADSFVLSGAGVGAVNGNDFAGINLLTGNGGSDSLTGTSAGDTWILDGVGSGTLAGLDFAGFSNLTGGGSNDLFLINDGGQVTGTLSGGGGYDAFVSTGGAAGWTMTGAGAGSFSNGSTTAFTAFEQLVANDAGDYVVGTAGNDTFNLNASGSANIAGVIDLVDFVGFDGANGNDRFILNDDYGITVAIGGGSGDDSLEATGASANLGAGSLFDGGSGGETLGDLLIAPNGNDDFYVQGSNAVNVGPIVATTIERLSGGSGTDSLYGSAAGDIWALANTGSTVAGINFISIEQLFAGNGSNTFNIGTYTGDITGGTGADLFVLNGSLTGNIDGNSGSDELSGSAGNDTVQLGTISSTFNGAGFTNIETLTGNGGTDTLIGAGGVGNTFNITGIDSGDIGSWAFSGFANLTGNTGSDTFNVANSGRVTGLLTGGGGSDSVNGSAGTEAWTLTGSGIGDVVNGAGSSAFTGMAAIDGAGGGDSLLFAGAAAQTIAITGSGDGNVGAFLFAGMSDIDAGAGADIFAITGAHTGDLLGGAGDDEFQFNGGSVTGTLVGGAAGETLGDRIVGTGGADAVVISGSEAGDINSTLFADIERIDAAGGSDTLSTSGANTWNLGGGTDLVSGISYLNFESISAGNGADTFNINGAVGYSLAGNGGDDSFNFNVGGSLAGDAFGGDGDDSFSMNGGSITGTMDGGSTGETLGDLVTGTLVADSFSVTGAGSGTVNTRAFTGIERLNGNDGNDTFAVADAGSINSINGAAGSADTLSVTSSVDTLLNTTTIVRGGSLLWVGVEDLGVTTTGAANLTIGTPVTVAGNVTLAAAGGIATTGSSRITAAAIDATATGTVNLYTDTADLDVVTSAASNLTVDELDGLTALHLAGNNVSLVAGGAVTDGDAAMDLLGTTSVQLNVATGNAGSSTSFLGVQAPAVNSVTGNGAQFLNFNSNVTSLNVNAGSNAAALRTSSSVVTVDQGAADQIVADGLLLGLGGFQLDGNNAVNTLAATTDNAVLFNNGSNALVIGTVGIVSGISTSNDAVDISAGNLDVNAAINTGSARLTLAATGNITQTAAITAGSLLAKTVAGDATLDGSVDTDVFAADVDGDLIIADADGFDIGTVGATTGITSAGFTAITAGGAVTDSALLNVNGLALAGSGPYTLDTAGNSFTTLAVDSTGPVALTQAGALTIGTVNGVSGVDTGSSNFALTTSAGGLTVTGNVSAGDVALTTTDASGIGGAGVVSGNLLTLNAGGDANLNTAISSLLASTGGALTVADSGDLLVDNAGAGSTLAISATGDLTVQEVSAASASLTAGGAILDGNGNLANVTAAAIVLDAGTDIGTVTDFATFAGDALEVAGLAAGGLQAQTGAGGALNLQVSGNYVAGNDDVQGADTVLLAGTGNLDISSGLAALATAGEIGLKASGTLTLPVTTSTGAGSVLQLSAGDVVASGRTLDFAVDTLNLVTASSGGGNTLTGVINNLSGSAAANLVIDVDSALTVDGLSNSNGFIDITVGTGDATVLNIATNAVDNGNNDINVTATNGNLIVGVLNAGVQNDVVLTASGNIVDVANTVHADRLDLDAGGDIGESTNAFNTDVNVIAANSDTGNIWIEEANGATFESVQADNGGVVITTPGNADLQDIRAGNSGITIVFGGGTLGDLDTDGDLDVTATGNVSSDGDLAGDSVTVVSTGGSVSVGDGSGSVVAGAGGVTVTGSTNAGVDNVTSDGDVLVTAGSGDALIGAVTTTSGNGGSVVVDAGDAITVVGTLDADDGVILTAGGNADLDAIIAGAGGVTSTAGGSSTLGDITVDGGDINLVADGNVVIGGLIETTGGVGNDIAVTSTGGGILMETTTTGGAAGITQTDDAVITLSAQDDVIITIIDAGSGGVVDITSTTGVVTVNERSRTGDEVANITAGDTSITGGGGIGSLTGPQLVIDTPTLELTSNGPVVEPILLQDTIVDFDGNLIPPLSQLLGNLSFDPELEGLAYLDPAIFTAVSNYATDEDALAMPEDQKVADGAGGHDEQPVAEQAPAATVPVESAQAAVPEIPLAMN